jgi:dihydroorotase
LQYAAFGAVGLETALALVITNLVNTGVLSMAEAIRRMTIEPARVLGIAAGTLAEGAVADVTVIDAEARFTVRSAEFKSKARNTPFEGFELTGKAAATIVRGEIVHGALKAAGVAAGV